MKILIVTATYPPSANGVAISTKRTALELRRQGHDVYIAAPEFKDRKEKIAINLPSLTNPLIPDYPIVLPLPKISLVQQIHQLNLDLVHVHHPLYVGGIAQLIGRSKKVPVVFTYHTRYDEYAQQYLPFLPKDLVKKQVDHLVTRFCNKCTAIIATTQTFQKELTAQLEAPVYYASTAGLTSSMLSSSSKNSLRKKLPLPPNKFILLSVSRHTIEKNLELILHTTSHLDPQEFHTVMVGDGLHSSKLKALTHKLGLTNVTFTGRKTQKQLPDYYTASNLFLYSSQTDTIGINILEAMSAKLPVIGVTDPSTAEVIKHNKNGYLLSSDAKAFALHVSKLKTNPHLYKKFSVQASKTADDFSIQNTTKQLVSIYHKIV